jgi:hypothetical protein
MKRYFFDIREGDQVAIDEEGKELPHVEAAQEEAARSLADLARDKIACEPFCHMTRPSPRSFDSCQHLAS